ncbi:hypothetical protein BaRGS_00007730, partial [Batillaria attramentaria]
RSFSSPGKKSDPANGQSTKTELYQPKLFKPPMVEFWARLEWAWVLNTVARGSLIRLPVSTVGGVRLAANTRPVRQSSAGRQRFVPRAAQGGWLQHGSSSAR